MQTIIRTQSTPEKIAEWGGCATGLTGSALLAVQTSISGWGFVFFLIANICWIVFGTLIGARGVVAQQSGFLVTSAMGILNWQFNGVVTKLILTVIH